MAGGAGNFSDMFEQLFWWQRCCRGVGQAHRAEPVNLLHAGQTSIIPITLTFEQAARGSTLPLQIESDGKIETIEIKIPTGVKDGARIRVKGRGQRGPGEAGDLYIVA